MNYQQTLKADGTVEPKCIVVINDNGDRRITWENAADPLWSAYLNWLAAGNAPLSAYTGPLSETVKTLSDKIDARVAAVYSNWTRFEREYELREDAARTFKAAGYAGDPGQWVSAFATSAGMSNQQAADLIIAQADQLHAALAALGALRMRKYEVLNATTPEAAQTTYDQIFASINTIAEGLS
ncbi:hypothetical protein [Paraburkholderia terrae]|uniref:hypothetical protein n=1 Tax=Paraburkholderia terrae TaxID=311230 RepID=UPI001EE1F490|nr:hypothetical protein [Paraburkholderia terrae]GJH00214.1 hypothetical protein CBA19C8_06675 [Paraburkholderia terrae]